MRISLDPPANHRPSRVTIIVAALVAIAILLCLVILAAVAPRGVPLLKYYYVNGQFKDAQDIKDLSAVQIAGRQVGYVSQVKYKNGMAIVTLQLLPGTPKLTSDATLRIRQKNPIGAQYVEVSPSTKGTPLADHATLPVSNTSAAVDTQELLSGFTPSAQKNITKTAIGLGQGFIGRGTGINEEMPVATPELRQLGQLAQTINDTPGAASNFAPSADSMAAAFDPVRVQAAEGFRPESQVLSDIGDERSVIQDTLQVAPSSFTALQTGLAKSDPLLRQITGFSHATVSLTKPAPAALTAFTKLMKTGVPSLQRSLPLLRSVNTAVSPTLSLLDTSYPIISPTDSTLNAQMLPLTTLISHSCDFMNETKNWRSAMSQGVPGNYDPLSNLSALEPGLGPDINSFRVIALAPTTTETLDADAPGKVTEDAYPAPCAAAGEVTK